MSKTLIFFLSLFSFIFTSKGQELFFIGDKSFPSSRSFTIKSNASDYERDDLKLLLIKDGNKGSIVAIRISYAKTEFSGDFIVYLKNGMVIKLTNPEMSDYVDDSTKAVYSLTAEQLKELINSDIHTVRYTLKCDACKVASSPEEGTWTASSKDLQTSRYIAEFFDSSIAIQKKQSDKQLEARLQTEPAIESKQQDASSSLKTDQPKGDPYANIFYDSKDSKGSNMGYGLSGRNLIDRTVVQPACSRRGRVVVRVVVDQKGKVIDAMPGVKGTTNKNRCLLEPAQKTALLHQWNADPKAPSLQIGFVVVEF